MKKVITSLIVFSLLILALIVTVGAEDVERGGTLRSISLYSYPTKSVYGAFEELNTDGLSLLAVYSDGSERIISGRDVRVSYLRDSCLRVGDDSVILSYGGKSISLPVTVNRIAYDLSELAVSGFSTVYNGKYQSYASMIPRVIGLDGIPLVIDAKGGGVNAGEYDISIDFSTESVDYLLPESRVITMTVAPATAQIVWSELSFTYDGRSKSPIAYYTDVNGAKVYPTVTGAATNAGTGYVARATVNDPNYKFLSTSVSYEIKKADYDFSGVVWSKDSFTYDGGKKSISASGLPAGVSVIGYTGDRGTDAGMYTAVAMLSWDERNYNAPASLTHTWEILKADYDMSGVEFKADSFVYDGVMHYPTLVGSMPVGADGIQLNYSFSAGACHVSEGVVSVVISFLSESKNYNLPPERHSSVSITPLGIEVNWGESSLSYTGQEQMPEAFAEECVIMVEGGRTDVGNYTATAITDNTDYYIKNDKIEYAIVKAENSWIQMPADSTCFEGKDIIIKGKSLFGDVIYTYYSDPEGITEISKPTECGKYYVRLSVLDTINYGGMESEILSLEIVEIVPVSFIAAITREDLSAFDRLSADDVICSVVNNDGSIRIVDFDSVKVAYENGDSFRRSDKSVTLKYGEFSFSLKISVGYADYDLSGVTWKNTDQVYDGSAKQPTLTGLPAGVCVSEYLGGEMINAGVYRVYARLDYDEENYNEPSIAPCDFRISKCPVASPYISATYNGEDITPVSDSKLYYVIGSSSFKNAGKYVITVGLADPDNYIFSDSSDDTDSGIFEILPATIGVKVYDVRLRLFEKLGSVEYDVISGQAFGSDFVGITPYLDGNRVLIRSNNPNYVLDVEAGRLIRLPYPTFNGFIIIMVIALGLVVLVLVCLRIYRIRHRLVSAGAMLKCRWHNRYFKAETPKSDPPKRVRKRPDFSYEARLAESDQTPAEEIDDEGYERDEDEIDENQQIIEFEIDADKADSLISDSLAKSLIKRDGEIIYTSGSKKAVMNVEDIGRAFSSGQRVDINRLKEKGLVDEDSAYLKVLGGGRLDKALSIYANEFSLSAVKMIALTGGQAIKTVTMREKSEGEKE